MRTYLDKIMSELDELGISLSNAIRTNRNNRLITAYQLIKKIRNNVYSLTILLEDNNAQTSKNLIYRCIFSDIMTALYLLDINDSEFEYSTDLLNIKHIKYFMEVIPIRLKVARKLFKTVPCEEINEQSQFDKYYDFFKNYLKNEKGKPWIINILPNNKSIIFNGTIKSIFEYLIKCEKNENLQALSNLYMYYKNLSQSEHFSLVGSNYPLYSESDVNWYLEMDAAIYSGIVEIKNLSCQYIMPLKQKN